MTEAMTTTSGAVERQLCEMGSETGRPCWREATDQVRELAHEPPKVCAEHKRVKELDQEADEHLTALDMMQEWISATAESAADTLLPSHAHRMRQRAERGYWPVVVAKKAATLIAGQPQGEKPPVSEAKMLAGMISDALMDAYVALSDISLDRRHKIMGALMVARDALPEEMPGPEPLH